MEKHASIVKVGAHTLKASIVKGAHPLRRSQIAIYRQSSAYKVRLQHGFLNNTVYFGTRICLFSTKSLLRLHGFLLTRLFLRCLKKQRKQRTDNFQFDKVLRASVVIVTFVNDKWNLFCIKVVYRNLSSSPFHLIYFFVVGKIAFICFVLFD